MTLTAPASSARRPRKRLTSGAIGMRVEERSDVRDTSVLFFYPEAADPNIPSMIDALGLDRQAQRFKISYGAVPRTRDEIAILTRSVIQILMEIASYVEVPPEHLAGNYARTTTAAENDLNAKVEPLIRIKSGPEKPEQAFVEIQYLNHWFWIEPGDFASKRIFTFVMLILLLSETGQGSKLPVLTIPAG